MKTPMHRKIMVQKVVLTVHANLHYAEVINLFINKGLSVQKGVDEIDLKWGSSFYCLQFFKLDLAAKSGPSV